jgi:hypothetical protein
MQSNHSDMFAQRRDHASDGRPQWSFDRPTVLRSASNVSRVRSEGKLDRTLTLDIFSTMIILVHIPYPCTHFASIQIRGSKSLPNPHPRPFPPLVTTRSSRLGYKFGKPSMHTVSVDVVFIPRPREECAARDRQALLVVAKTNMKKAKVRAIKS